MSKEKKTTIFEELSYSSTRGGTRRVDNVVGGGNESFNWFNTFLYQYGSDLNKSPSKLRDQAHFAPDAAGATVIHLLAELLSMEVDKFNKGPSAMSTGNVSSFNVKASEILATLINNGVNPLAVNDEDKKASELAPAGVFKDALVKAEELQAQKNAEEARRSESVSPQNRSKTSTPLPGNSPSPAIFRKTSMNLAAVGKSLSGSFTMLISSSPKGATNPDNFSLERKNSKEFGR